MKQARRLRVPSLTILQMMKLVVMGSVASACLAFFARLSEEGVGHGSPWFIPLMGGLFIPLALALVAFPLLRKGQLKDWFILVLVAIPLSVILGVGFLEIVRVIRERSMGRQQPPLDYFELGMTSVIFILLGLALFYVFRRIVPARCPDCRRLTLLPDAKFRVQPDASRGRTYQCFRCQGQFRKLQGRWEAIPTDPSTLEF
jgi:cytochrome c biogenesis factor